MLTKYDNGAKMYQVQLSYFSLDLYPSIFTDSSIFRNQCIEYILSQTNKLPSKRTSFTFGNDGLCYSINFKGYGNNQSNTVVRVAAKWDSIPLLPTIRDHISTLTGKKFTYCVLQFYPSGKQGIKPHKDREMIPGTSIVGLSLGATRTLTMIPPKFLDMEPVNIKLSDGCLYSMNPPTNDYWMHSIPVDESVSGYRISLTFRNL